MLLRKMVGLRQKLSILFSVPICFSLSAPGLLHAAPKKAKANVAGFNLPQVGGICYLEGSGVGSGERIRPPRYSLAAPDPYVSISLTGYIDCALGETKNHQFNGYLVGIGGVNASGIGAFLKWTMPGSIEFAAAPSWGYTKGEFGEFKMRSVLMLPFNKRVSLFSVQELVWAKGIERDVHNQQVKYKLPGLRPIYVFCNIDLLRARRWSLAGHVGFELPKKPGEVTRIKGGIALHAEPFTITKHRKNPRIIQELFREKDYLAFSRHNLIKSIESYTVDPLYGSLQRSLNLSD